MTTPHNDLTADALLEQAKSYREQGNTEASADYLRTYLLREQALLRLARSSTGVEEARAAAQLAISLMPSDALTQRVQVDVEKRFVHTLDQPPDRARWPSIIALTTRMTLEQARAVIWPFNQINRPIGTLLDDGTCTVKDLLWACDNARNPRVQDASRTILLTHLLDAAPEQPPKPLTIIPGSRYSEREERVALVLAGAAVGITIVLAAVLVVGATVLFIIGNAPFIALAMYALMVLALIAFRFFSRRAQQATAFKLGRWGEERVVEALRTSLDGRWTLVRNFVWPARNDGDIDIVLVGPGGVWVFEIKAYNGTFRNIGDTWERKTKRGWGRLEVHPGAQARSNAANLKAFLDAQGITVGWVQPAVIWAGGEATHPDDRGTLIVEQPKTPVWESGELADRVVDLWQSHRTLDNETISMVVNLLRQTVQQAVPSTPTAVARSAMPKNPSL